MYYCLNCGYKSIKWLGKCPACDSWESFLEEKKEEDTFLKRSSTPLLLREIDVKDTQRVTTGIEEFDRILGGGIVKGEVILIGGEPGVGKSTFLLEVGARLSQEGRVLYLNAEESPYQVSIRAKRLKANFAHFYVLDEDNLVEVQKIIEKEKYNVVIVDSIQVVYHPKIEAQRGSPVQIKGCADFLTRIAKLQGITIFIVGHVTKEGIIAGPKLLEHIVDCVLYFESEKISNYRVLRATKNRFGSTGDIAVFEMTSWGLRQVNLLSNLFLPHRDKEIAGSCVVCVIEGVKPFLVEIQSLVNRTSFSMVKRKTAGFDPNRFTLLIATIEKRLRLSLASYDIFLNVAGGMRITDPAADLGAIVAIVSSLKEKIFSSYVFLGEVGLAGEVRAVNNINLRLREIKRGGFKNCFLPQDNLKEVDEESNSLNLYGVASIKEIFSSK
ncbi:MAG: DNA repair protein RadA [Candidatus Omnitrophica bacterium 4484_70.1]|nr:MAG: DNA repair protein RadA [Candidatus Omnitrophica bacterium 4484_70.1]